MSHLNRSQSDIEAIYQAVHPDYRGTCNRVKSIMYLCPETGSTVLGPIKDLPESVYQDRLDSARRKS